MTQYTICFDTICDGFQPVEDIKMIDGREVRSPIKFDTEDQAAAEIKSDPAFYEDCFVCRLDEIGHKTI